MAAVMLVAAAVVATALIRAAPGQVRDWFPLTGVVALFVISQAGLALWSYPYGWIAWGPRLTVPLVPAVLVALAHTGGEPLKAMLDRVARSLWGAAAAGSVLVATALPQAGAVWNYPAAIAALIEPGGGCPSLLELGSPPSEQLLDCQEKVMWRWTPSFLLGPLRSDRLPAQAGQATLALGLAALTLAWHRSAAGGATARRAARIKN